MFGLMRVKTHKRLSADAESLYNGRVQNLVLSQERQMELAIAELFRYQKTRLNFCANCGQNLVLKGQ